MHDLKCFVLSWVVLLSVTVLLFVQIGYSANNLTAHWISNPLKSIAHNVLNKNEPWIYVIISLEKTNSLKNSDFIQSITEKKLEESLETRKMRLIIVQETPDENTENKKMLDQMYRLYNIPYSYIGVGGYRNYSETIGSLVGISWVLNNIKTPQGSWQFPLPAAGNINFEFSTVDKTRQRNNYGQHKELNPGVCIFADTSEKYCSKDISRLRHSKTIGVYSGISTNSNENISMNQEFDASVLCNRLVSGMFNSVCEWLFKVQHPPQNLFISTDYLIKQKEKLEKSNSFENITMLNSACFSSNDSSGSFSLRTM